MPLKRFLITVGAFLALTFSTAFVPSNQVFKAVRPLQASIRLTDAEGDKPALWSAPRNVCTTTALAGKAKLWITAAHCYFDPEARFYISDQAAFPWTIDVEHDLALFMVPGLNVKGLKLAADAPSVGDAIAVVGHPLGLDPPQLFQGFISNVNGDYGDAHPYMLYDMQACQGNSGSSVLVEGDKLVSILQIGIGVPPCGHFTGGATYNDLKAFLKKYAPAAL